MYFNTHRLPNCISKSLGETNEVLWTFQSSSFKAAVKGPGLDVTERGKGS